MDRLEEVLRARIDEAFGGNESELARAIGTEQQNVNNFVTGKVKNSHIWREIAKELGILEEEMRRLIAERKEARRAIAGDAKPNATVLPLNPASAAVRMIPILGEAVGGADGEYVFNGQVLDYAPCPPILANVPNAYAVLIDGVSMIPRYYPREVAYVHPNRPVRHDDHVVVQLRPRDEGMPPRGFVKKFAGWKGNRLVLEQYNPAQQLEFQREDVVSVHLIILSGEY